MISVKNLTRKYADLTAVNSVSFDIEKGQIIGLLGHNGAGKTTTLKMLTGYLEPTSGSVTIDGINIEDDTHTVQKKIGYLSEQSPLYTEMTVWQYLEYVAKLRGISEDHLNQAILDAIHATDLQDKVTSTIDTLSKGYRQRVGVAQAIIHKPEILILDEPTNGLDPTQIQAMRGLITHLAKNATVIISTHIMQEVEAICDRVLIILNGKLVVDEKIENLQKANSISLSLKQDLRQVEPLLCKIDGVSAVDLIETKDAIHHYILKTTDNTMALPPKVARAVMQEGWDLFHLHQEHRTLESVFKEVNRHVGANHV